MCVCAKDECLMWMCWGMWMRGCVSACVCACVGVSVHSFVHAWVGACVGVRVHTHDTHGPRARAHPQTHGARAHASTNTHTKHTQHTHTAQAVASAKAAAQKRKGGAGMGGGGRGKQGMPIFATLTRPPETVLLHPPLCSALPPALSPVPTLSCSFPLHHSHSVSPHHHHVRWA